VSTLKEKFSKVNFAGILTVVGVSVAGYFVYQYLKRKLPADKAESYPVAFPVPDAPSLPAVKAIARTKEKKGMKPKKTRRPKPSPDLAFPGGIHYGSPYAVSGLASLAGCDCEH